MLLKNQKPAQVSIISFMNETIGLAGIIKYEDISKNHIESKNKSGTEIDKLAYGLSEEEIGIVEKK